MGGHKGETLLEFAEERDAPFKQPRDPKLMSAAELEQELMWRRWFPKTDWDATAFINDDAVVDAMLQGFSTFCVDVLHVKIPGKGAQPLVLRDAQRVTVRAWLKYRMTVSLKARQIGFSTVSAAFALWLAFAGGDRQIIMLSKGEREAVSLLGKARYAYRKLPEWVRKRGPMLLDRVSTRMTFDNESSIESLPSTQPGRGETAFMVFMDELGFLPNPEEAWSAVEPATDVGGRLAGLGTANGEGNFFHQVWLASQEKGWLPGVGSNGFHGVFFPWWSVPGRDEAWFERKRAAYRDQPSKLFQEYPGTPEDAFQGSGNPVYSLELLRAMTATDPVRTVSVSGLSSPKVSDGGPWKIWREPDRTQGYVIGADVSFGLSHGDYSVAFVMEVQSGEIVAMYREKIDPDEYARELASVGWWYNSALVVPEVNNHGLTTLKALQRFRYPSIYRRRTFSKRTEGVQGQTMGWLTTNNTKPLMVDELGAWLRDHNVPDFQTIQELRTFVRVQKANMIQPRFSGSPHDDCVMALAITVMGSKFANEHGLAEPKMGPAEGTYDWWMKSLEKQDRKKRSGARPGVRA